MDSLLHIDKPLCLTKPLLVPKRLLSGPGPSNMHQDVCNALSTSLLGHLHPEFTQIMDDVKAGIQYIFQTSADWCLAVSGTGHCVMEASCMNLLEPGETVLICRNGIWGDRFKEVSERLSVHPVLIDAPIGSVFNAHDIEEGLRMHKPSVVFVTHGESSTGALQPLEGLGALCHKYGALLLVDSVAAACGVPLLMDKWEIDCIYTGSQKCLSCTPGICPIAFSEKAKQKIMSRKTKPQSWYLDIKELANYWGCRTTEPSGIPIVRRYHHTAPISLVYALREALRHVVEEGIANMWKRHAAAATRLYQGLESLRLEPFVSIAQHRAPTVTTIKVPSGYAWKDVCVKAMQKFSVEIAGGLGPTVGHVWRIGLMGINATNENVEIILEALEQSLLIAGQGDSNL